MRIISLLPIILLLSLEIISQPIYTKDFVLLGYQDDVFSDCLGADNQNYLYVNNRLINKHFFCKCIIAELIPKIRFDELKSAIDNDKMEELFLQKKYLKVIDPCMKHYAEIENAYSFDNVEISEKDKQLYITICIENFDLDSEFSNSISPQIKKDYCECEVNTMIKNGYSLNQIFEIGNEDSEAFNEIIVPCFTEIMGHFYDLEASTAYEPDDIHGDYLKSAVSLIDYMGQGYKIKLSIGGITKYYYFDTGATFLVISSEFEQELLSTGKITLDNYKDITEIMLANNEIIEARIIELNNIVIGSFIVDNVTVAVIDGGALLCGNSLLNKFSKWEIDTEQMQLILYK